MSEGDGHQGIVGVAAEVCQAVLEKDARVEQVDTPTITNRISSEHGGHLLLAQSHISTSPLSLFRRVPHG